MRKREWERRRCDDAGDEESLFCSHARCTITVPYRDPAPVFEVAKGLSKSRISSSPITTLSYTNVGGRRPRLSEIY